MSALVKRLLVPAALVVAFAMPTPIAWAQPTASKADQLRTLSLSHARYWMGQALERRFGVKYSYRVGGGVKCRRSSWIRARCRMQWGIGDLGYYGSGYIWYDLKAGDLWWNYSWRIVRTNYYCLSVLKRPLYRCTRRSVVR